MAKESGPVTFPPAVESTTKSVPSHASQTGLDADGRSINHDHVEMHRLIALKLAAAGISVDAEGEHDQFMAVAHDLLANYREQARLLSGKLCPADQRIQAYLDRILKGVDCGGDVRLPSDTLVVEHHGLARELSIPASKQSFDSAILSSRRLRNGVLHNPFNDKRTTKGTYHVAAGGLPVPGDKKEVPLETFGRILRHAVESPPEELTRLPYLAGRADANKPVWVSLMLRPVVVPAVPGRDCEKRLETRFFAPGNLVCNLDFVESVFGNAGDPNLPANDAALDVDGWTGHSGCVILAPHLVKLRKKDLGLPHISKATARQKKDGMCWESEDELYNDGGAFKLTSRDTSGVIVTIIADNYFGYCKKEVKGQISYSANLYGLAEEEHAGGALAFVRISYGDAFHANPEDEQGRTMEHVKAILGDSIEMQPGGNAIDKEHPNIIYVPETMKISLPKERVSWTTPDGSEHHMKLLTNRTYILPSGYRLHMEKHPAAPSWRLVGTKACGTFCHKPCTVSGGGKSEISKSLVDAVLYGPIFVHDLDSDLKAIEAIFARDFSKRLRPEIGVTYTERASRAVLDPKRSLGSVIKMFTPAPTVFTDEYNAWLESVPRHIWPILFAVKRFYKPEWENQWKEHFRVDIINGEAGHELKVDDRKLVGSYLRVGLNADGSWRVFKLRADFIAAHKVQMEDDISASVVVPARALGFDSDASVKLVTNCEHRLFQRPDDAIHRGYDKQTEFDMSQNGLFCSNFEPLDKEAVGGEVDDALTFDKYTNNMKEHLIRGPVDGGFLVSSARPRVLRDGSRTKNPRYLQVRTDYSNREGAYLGNVCTRLSRSIRRDLPISHPVDAVLCGRRNNPPEPGIKPLAVYGPIHYQELPELFMDFVSSLTGKSPSTTGAGSEGALTKGPFNPIRTTPDLNNALVNYVLCGQQGFSSAAGYIGSYRRVDHDISLLIPEIWCRLTDQEKDADWLIKNGHLEPVKDFEYNGRTIKASRLGYRITPKFRHQFLGKVFDSPAAVFDEALLRPESQNLDDFAAGVDNIVDAQKRVAQQYLEDGSVEDACPPLKALLHIMATGSYEGKDEHHPDIRKMFTKEYLLGSAWYRQRLSIKQQRDKELWSRHVAYLESFLSRKSHADVSSSHRLAERLAHAKQSLEAVSSKSYVDSLVGTLGADPIGPYCE